MVANSAGDQLNRKKLTFPYLRSRLRICSRKTDSAVPSRVSLLILHTQAESCAYSCDNSVLVAMIVLDWSLLFDDVTHNNNCFVFAVFLVSLHGD